MRAAAALVIVALALLAGAVTPAHADRWPPELWADLDRQRI